MLRTDPVTRKPHSLPARIFRSRAILLVAFAFAVMGDPVSSVAYAIEAALRALGGNLGLLLPTMALVIGIIGLVIVNYHQMVARFPQGGGDAAAAGAAFGEGWAFVPIGSLLVDYVLTISISVAAGASAIVAYFPSLAAGRVPLALGLLLLVAGLTWFGHGGRAVFASMTLSFVGVGTALVLAGAVNLPSAGHPLLAAGPTDNPLLSVIFAFPVAMALATGVEAPSSAMAQLGQLDNDGRRRFGQVTLWLTLAIVGGFTLSLTALAVWRGIGIPPEGSTQVAEVARAGGSVVLFAGFQLTTMLLLLAAASSSFQAGPGLLKALARTGLPYGETGVLPTLLGRTNRHHTPYWGVVVCLACSAAVVSAGRAREQQLILFYAVAVFLSFFVGLLSMARFNRAESQPVRFTFNVIAASVVGFTLLVNLGRGYPVISLVAALGLAGGLHGLWVRAGRPRGIASAVARAGAEVDDMSAGTG